MKKKLLGLILLLGFGSAQAQTDIKFEEYDLCVCNLANLDMVGHTGNYQAVIKAIETVDTCTKQLVNKMKEYSIIIIADHGNAEYMINNDKSPNTAHTINKVPIFLISSNKKNISNGKLCDVAPTILDLLKLQKPEEMSGKSLLT